MHTHQENARRDSEAFWQRIREDGDFRTALAEFDVHYNEDKPCHKQPQ